MFFFLGVALCWRTLLMPSHHHQHESEVHAHPQQDAPPLSTPMNTHHEMVLFRIHVRSHCGAILLTTFIVCMRNELLRDASLASLLRPPYSMVTWSSASDGWSFSAARVAQVQFRVWSDDVVCIHLTLLTLSCSLEWRNSQRS